MAAAGFAGLSDIDAPLLPSAKAADLCDLGGEATEPQTRNSLCESFEQSLERLVAEATGVVSVGGGDDMAPLSQSERGATLSPVAEMPSPAELRTDLGPLAPPRPPASASFSVPPVAVCPPAPARLKPRASAEPQLTVEEYVAAMNVLVHDMRFTLYNVCYKRLLLVWVLLGFFILLCLLFSGVRGLALFGGGVVWLVVNALGIFVCMWLKFKASTLCFLKRHLKEKIAACYRKVHIWEERQVDLLHMLERCIASINSLFFRHKILLGLDDRGKISCHKVHKYAEKLLLRYSQRWVKEFVRKRLDLNMPVHPDGFEDGPCPPAPPRHCALARCPCQFIEEHLRFKPLTKCSLSELCF
ncbi:hypothetical protein HPB51_023495 [Rhipicephalus microplus]|uniref:Uncharacterized protein n=1 Tax=Rhipicephalus microplus TaxID=6941 RepID=A0A9J6EJS7_RHIMP|nr:hypothetical protein HPB51_023495 [Rhipicephalus microplus]